MRVGLLYADRDWDNTGRYEDDRTIVQDLNLHILFHTAAQQVIWKKKDVEKIAEADLYIEQTMRLVMMTPLKSEAQIVYRQEILQDFMKVPDLAWSLYELAIQMQKDWNELGRNNKQQSSRSVTADLLTRIHVVSLFLRCASRVKKLLREKQEVLTSQGMRNLLERFDAELSDEQEKKLWKVIDDLSFFATEQEREERMKRGRICVPKIVLGCRIGQNLKFDDFTLDLVESKDKKYHKPGGMFDQLEDKKNALIPDSVPLKKSTSLLEQAAYLERVVVSHLCDSLNPFVSGFSAFIDQLKLQTSFYIGALNLHEHLKRYELTTCFPKVSEKKQFVFENLMEYVMCLEQHKAPVGNTCRIEDKHLVVITGANQGGKSTFLRSIGIAQVMLQCGLPVLAQSYESALYPKFFTHFTRREDSAMNSGRLDEEMRRMSQIVDRLDKDSLILLNESFATTTEKEGSIIAYDILKAFSEAGIMVLTVTHLLTFAQQVYREMEGKADSPVTFFSAERLEDGQRTFKMIQSVPQLTSFGLDLYDSMIGKRFEKQ